MASVRAVSNEELIAAILSSRTLTEAANKAGISLRTLQERMHEHEFRLAYTDAKSEVLRAAVQATNAHLTEAIETVADIMKDKTTNPAVRMQAAQTIINQSVKIIDRLQIAETNFNNGY